MHEILDHLPPGARVLDLGARGGSFRAADYPALIVISADLSAVRASGTLAVQTDAAALPFASRAFDAIILNHSLEHFDRLKPALQEIGRIVRSNGAVYVAVPDARTFTDRLYRKVFRARGGHVNLFGSADELRRTLSWYFGLAPAGTRVLCNSLAFLNRHNATGDRRARRLLKRGLPEFALLALTAILRRLDRRFGSRLTVYGWAFYFGAVGEPVAPAVRVNICIRCGAAHPAAWLQGRNAVRKTWGLLRSYACPDCGAVNLFTPDPATSPAE